MNCITTLSARNVLFEYIVNLLTVEKSVAFFDHNDEVILTAILGANNECVKTFSDTEWYHFIERAADYLFSLKTGILKIEYKTRYSFI